MHQCLMHVCDIYFARFFVFALFSVSMCVSCFFVMGGQQRWANASTGSLPLWQLMCMIYVMYLVDKLSLSLVSSPKTKSSRQIRLKCSIWLIETGIGDPVVPDDVEESATSGISELTSLSASWTVGDLASRRLLLCSWGGHSPTLHPSVCPSVSICPIHLARYLPGAAAPDIDVQCWCTSSCLSFLAASYSYSYRVSLLNSCSQKNHAVL